MLYVKEGRKMNSIKQIEIIYDNRLVGRLALLRTTSNFLKYIQENEMCIRDRCMSRTTFYNKWKLLTGEAPKYLISRIRMEKARELLESGKFSVTVSNSGSYCTDSCFHAYSGVVGLAHSDSGKI